MFYLLKLLLISIGCCLSQDLLNEGNCDIMNKYATCPASHCCVRDEFFREIKYCKEIGVLGDSCSTVTTDSDCPCGPGLYCKPNIYSAHFTSIYGTCVMDPRVTTGTTMDQTKEAHHTTNPSGEGFSTRGQTKSIIHTKPLVDGTTITMASQTSTKHQTYSITAKPILNTPGTN